jgi:hypothetical protein
MVLSDPPESVEWEWELWEELWRVLAFDGFMAINCNARLMAKLILLTRQPPPT